MELSFALFLRCYIEVFLLIVRVQFYGDEHPAKTRLEARKMYSELYDCKKLKYIKMAFEDYKRALVSNLCRERGATLVLRRAL